jgi:PKD repeat protein
MKFRTLALVGLTALVSLVGFQARADNMASIAITPATGAVTLVPRWVIGGSLTGFHHMAQDLSLGGGANQFYSITANVIPAGGNTLAFNAYIAGSGAATPHADIGSKLTPSFYRALTSADPDLGYGSVNFYLIHRKGTTDYLTVIKPSSGTASAVTDLKPMSGPGGPATLGDSGYFGLTFAAANLGYGLNYFYYLRTDPVTNHTQFGTLDPALLGTGTFKFDLGTGGYNALAFTGTDVGYGTDKMYYLRLDAITGFTILGTLHPLTGRSSDIANLGSVFSTLTFVPGDVGFGSGRFYTAGAVNTTWQSVSFVAIADRAIATGSFTVAPSASSGLAIALTIVPGSVGAASISGPVGGFFTVTPTAPGLITLQATQAGVVGTTEFNMLRQSFTATGTATLAITSQPSSQSAVTGTTAGFTVTASGTSALSYQWRKAGANIGANASALTASLSLSNVQAVDGANYDVVVTNASGSIASNVVALTVTTAAPIITSATTAPGTVGTPFVTYLIVATGSPTSYGATGLPAGLTLNTLTGAINGTPTAAGVSVVTLSATNSTGTDTQILTVTVAAAGVAPIITNNPLTAAGTVGTPFSFTITATGSPTTYGAAGLSAGLSLNALTGVINGTPTTAGVSVVTITATNSTGTDTDALTITVVTPGIGSVITNNPLTAAGTIGVPFSFAIIATGSPEAYAASGLPAGLKLNAATGVISGTPTTAGVTVVPLNARNDFGSAFVTLTITISTVTTAPIITSPATAPGTVGVPFATYFVAATGLPKSFTATGLPVGLSINALTGAIRGTPTTAGVYTVALAAVNAFGTGTAVLKITVAAANIPPIITGASTAAGTVGTPFVTYLIAATGLPTGYSATGLPPGLTVNALTGAINGTPTTAGTYVVTVSATNAAGSSSATVTMVIGGLPGASSQIVNFAARALSGPGDQSLIMGFVVAGNGKNLLVRGIGPGLRPYGVASALADPLLTLFTPAGVLATNDDWQTTLSGLTDGALIAATAARVGAFALPNGSKDSALLLTVNNGAHTTGLVRPNGATGVALTEIYDIDRLPGSRLTNVSARMNVTAGEGTLIAGLVIVGNAPTTVLIRGVGPTLSVFGVAGVLADPTIALFAGTTPIASNDNWEAGPGTVADMTGAAAKVGAFALAAGSKDAALLITLQPGTYTVQVTGVGNTTGVALIEVYDTK